MGRRDSAIDQSLNQAIKQPITNQSFGVPVRRDSATNQPTNQPINQTTNNQSGIRRTGASRQRLRAR
eukprot:7211494-Prymnesium_polylepis.1